MPDVEVGQHWRRRDGREVLDIRRVWTYPNWREGEDAEVVRGHPVRGGKPLVCPVEYLVEHYERLGATDAD